MRAGITDGTSRARLAPGAAAAGVAFAWCLLAGCSGRPAGYAGEDATPPLLDAGTGPDAAAVADAAPPPDGSGCVEVPTRFPSSESYPDWDNGQFYYEMLNHEVGSYNDEYERLAGCEGQPHVFQDARCLDWMLDQFAPELTAAEIADLGHETVVVIEYDPFCCPGICSVTRCLDRLTLSVQAVDCGGPDVVAAAAAMIVIPKTSWDEIDFECYDGIGGYCNRGMEPISTDAGHCF
jgi:hypothetical protein